MAQTIKLKRSATENAVPTTSQLELGEVAINTYDGKLYIKKDVAGSESIVEVGGLSSVALGGLSDVTISSVAADQLLQYNGSEWVNVSIAEASAIMKEYQFTATAGQSTFTGADDNSETLSYTAGAIQVFLNGIFLDSAVDYTATSGTSIVLTETVDANDYLQVVAFKKKIGDGNVSVDTFTGDDSTVAFTLSVDPGDENNTRVFIDGVYQSKSNYSVSGTTLTFSTAPPTGTAVEVEIGNRVVTLDTLSDLDLPDSVRLRLGTGQDLQIYHDGSTSWIQDSSADLRVESNGLTIRSTTQENYIEAAVNGAVTVYYDGSAKLATTNDGVTITGDVEADEFIGDLRGAVLFKAQAGEALAKGEVVYISGISGNTTIVSKADADDASKMPAFGLVAVAASSGNPVDIYTNGILSGIDTSSYSEGDELFVSTTAGSLTSTPPTGESAALQKIGKVTRSALSGSIFIVGAGRTNAVPNLDDGDIFIGNASNQAVSASLNTKIEDYLDGGTSTPTFAGLTTTADVSFGDNDKAIFGAGSDLQIYHSGATSFITENGTGDLRIGANDLLLRSDNVYVQSEDGTANAARFNSTTGVTLFRAGVTKLETTSTGIDVTGNIAVSGTVDGRDVAADGTKLDGIEASADVTDTANVTAAGALMDSEVTNLAQVKAFDSSDYATAAQGTTADSAMQDLVDDTTPQLGGDLASNGNDILFADNDKAIFGAGSDLQIYHDGSTSIIKDAGTGELQLHAENNLRLQNLTGSTYALFSNGAAASLYYNGSAKLATTSTGIDVTGNIDVTSTVTSAYATVSGGGGGGIDTRFNIKNTGNGGSGRGVALSFSPSGSSSSVEAVKLIGFQETAATTANNASFVAQVANASGTLTERFRINGVGDISFYESTGTTPKFFWDASAESLGIGTSSPSTLLHLGGTAPGDSIIRQDSTVSGTNWEIGEREAGKWQIFEDDSDSIVATFMSSGNVGIGTSSPALSIGSVSGTVLHAAGAGTTGARFQNTSGTSIEFFAGTDAVINTATSTNLVFQKAGSETMRIDSSGALNLGTTVNVFGGADRYGFNFFASGQFNQSIDGTNDAIGQFINRENADGPFTKFYKDRAEVGSIGTDNGIPYFLRTSGGIAIGNTALLSADSSGAINDAASDLGGASNRWKDLYLSGVAYNGDGSALSPSISFGADTNTGFYRVGSDQIGFVTAGSLKAKLDSSGNLLVGKSSSAINTDGVELLNSGRLFLTTTSLAHAIRRKSTDGALVEFQKDGTTVGSIGTKGGDLFIGTGDSAIRFNDTDNDIKPWNTSTNAVNDGTISLGYSAGRFKDLYLSGNINLAASSQINSSTAFYLDSDIIHFRRNNEAESARIDSSGNLLVGCTALPTGSVAGFGFTADQLYTATTATSANTQVRFYNGNGLVGNITTDGSATTYNTSSDQRLKDNIVDAPSASDDIDAIQVRSFDWKADGSHQKYGMVAQELQSVAPEAVTGDADSDDMMGVDYSKLVPMLVKALQESRQEINNLKSRVEELESL